MTEAEANELFVRLMSELRSRREKSPPVDRDDFLKAIETEIDEGKPVQVRLKVRGEKLVDDPVVGKRQEGSSSGEFIQRQEYSPKERLGILGGEFIQRQEYSPKERLGILVDGLGLATVAPPLMAQRFLNTITSFAQDVTDVRMSDDQTVEARRQVQPQQINAANASLAPLRKLLDEVRRELSNRDPSPHTAADSKS